MSAVDYGPYLTRARLDAAKRLHLQELEDVPKAAARIGITKSYLYKLEGGRDKPTLDMLEKIASAYGVLPGDILPSTALSGPEVDRIVAPIMTLPEPTRSSFITQMEAFARALAAGIANAQLMMEAQAIRNANIVTNPSPETYSDITTQKQDAGLTFGGVAGNASIGVPDGAGRHSEEKAAAPARHRYVPPDSNIIEGGDAEPEVQGLRETSGRSVPRDRRTRKRAGKQ